MDKKEKVDEREGTVNRGKKGKQRKKKENRTRIWQDSEKIRKEKNEHKEFLKKFEN